MPSVPQRAAVGVVALIVFEIQLGGNIIPGLIVNQNFCYGCHPWIDNIRILATRTSHSRHQTFCNP